MFLHTTLLQNLRRGLLVCSLALVFPFSLIAQETTQQAESPTKNTEQAEPMDKGSPHHMSEHRQKMHEQMEAMHKEMSQELQKQLAALREHAQAMAGVTDTQQLVTEMKKHQQLTDTLLGTMIEQHQKMHDMMQEHHAPMHEHMGKKAEAGCCSMKQKEAQATQQ